MLLTRCKLATAALLLATALGLGVGHGVFQALAGEPANARTQAPPPPAANGTHDRDKGKVPLPSGAGVPQKQPEWKELFTLKHEGAVTAVAAGGGMVAVADAGCRLRLWDARDGKEMELPIRGAKFTTPAGTLRFTVNAAYLVVSDPARSVLR